MNVVIYSRVSKDTQCYQRQVDELKAHAKNVGAKIVKIFAEKISGVSKERPAFQNMLTYVTAHNGDIKAVWVHELSRLGRNSIEVVSTIEMLYNQNINLFIYNYNIYSILPSGKRDPMTKFMINILSSVAEMERENTMYRLNSGRERYKRNGGKFGRDKGVPIKDKKRYLKEYPQAVKYLKQKTDDGKNLFTMREIAKLCDCSLSTVDKLKKLIA
jgi:DNA invertase Pin-like site-specific DNA recombinase